MAAEGVVVATVQNVGALGSIAGSLTQNGIVDAVANQISSLAGLGGVHGAGGNGHIEPVEISRPWQIEQYAEMHAGRSDLSWDPKGMTGFSLRYTYDHGTSDGQKAEIIFESFVRDRTLILQMTSTTIPQHASVLEYRVLQADGRPLPQWLDRAGPEVLIGQRPADVEQINLRVIAILSDGTTIEREVTVQTNSGEIQPFKPGKRAEIAPLFSEQLAQRLLLDSKERDELALALAE